MLTCYGCKNMGIDIDGEGDYYGYCKINEVSLSYEHLHQYRPMWCDDRKKEYAIRFRGHGNWKQHNCFNPVVTSKQRVQIIRQFFSESEVA